MLLDDQGGSKIYKPDGLEERVLELDEDMNQNMTIRSHKINSVG